MRKKKSLTELRSPWFSKTGWPASNGIFLCTPPCVRITDASNHAWLFTCVLGGVLNPGPSCLCGKHFTHVSLQHVSPVTAVFKAFLPYSGFQRLTSGLMWALLLVFLTSFLLLFPEHNYISQDVFSSVFEAGADTEFYGRLSHCQLKWVFGRMCFSQCELFLRVFFSYTSLNSHGVIIRL